MSYLPAPLNGNLRGAWSPCARLVSGYAGSLVDLTFNNGTAQSFGCATGTDKLDVAAVISWWQAEQALAGDTLGYGGIMPRVSKIYNQSTDQPNAHWVQATDEDRPILDMNLLRSDGLIPISFNNYNARSTYSDGTSIGASAAEDLTFMTISSANLAANSTNGNIFMVVDGACNVGVSSTTSYALTGINTSTASNRLSLCAGFSSFASNMGYGAAWDTTAKFPTDITALAMPLRRVLLECHSSTALTIDGQAGPVMSLQMNGGTAQVFARTGATSGTMTTWYLGTSAAGTDTIGAAFGFYGMVYVGNGNIATVANEQRQAFRDVLYEQLGVTTSEQYHVAFFGSSSMANYATSGAGGIPTQVQNLLGNSFRCAAYAKAGTSNGTLGTNKVALSAAKRAGVVNVAVIVNARNDLGTGGLSGAATWAAQYALIDQLVADGWDHVISCTLWPSVKGGSVTQTTYNVERGAFNALVMDATEQATHGHVGLDLCTLPYFNASPSDDVATAAQFNDYTYLDDQIHTRGYTAGAGVAGMIASAIQALVAGPAASSDGSPRASRIRTRLRA